jgi:hypothetical protein
MPVVADRVNFPGADSGSLAGQFRQVLVAQTLPGDILVQSPEASPHDGQPPASSFTNAGTPLEGSLRTLEFLRRAVTNLVHGSWGAWKLEGWLKALLGSSLGPKANRKETAPVDAAKEEDEDDEVGSQASGQHLPNGTWLVALPMLGLVSSTHAHRRFASQVTVELHGKGENDRSTWLE